MELMTSALSDWEICKRIALTESDPLRMRILPFAPEQAKTLSDGRQCVSYGLTCKGYDIRLGQRFRHMKPDRNREEPVAISPFTPVEDVWYPPSEIAEGNSIIIPPGDCVLAESWEWVRIPEDCQTLVLCKSTWARLFLNLNTTPLEPGWQGTITLELHNQSKRHLKVFAGHGIGQLVFLAGSVPNLPYNRRTNPTYQDQSGPTPARMKAPDLPRPEE